jgi:hypothetical protein
LGAAMASSAFSSADMRKYCHNGGMAFAPGVEIGGDDDRPLSPPLASPSRSNKSLQSGLKACWGVRGSSSFGGEDQRLCLFSTPREVLPQRGMTFADWSVEATPSGHDASTAPALTALKAPISASNSVRRGVTLCPHCPLRCPPQKVCICRQMSRRGSDSISFGGSDGLAWLAGQTREVLPQRGHVLRRPSTASACWGPRRRSWPLPAVP